MHSVARFDGSTWNMIDEGQANGSISPTVSRETSARIIMCLFQGIRVVGAAGLPELGGAWSSQ